MKVLTTTSLLIVLVTVIAIADVKVKADRVMTFDFTKLKTWSWNPSGPGDVKIWVTADSKSEPVKRQYEPVIVQAVEDQFTQRGFTKATGAPPDFTVTYYVLVTIGNNSQYMGQFLPTNAQYGLPLFTPATTAINVYPQGTMVLDVGSPGPSTVVWRGLAEAKVEMENTEAKRTARIKDVIKSLVAKFPKK